MPGHGLAVGRLDAEARHVLHRPVRAMGARAPTWDTRARACPAGRGPRSANAPAAAAGRARRPRAEASARVLQAPIGLIPRSAARTSVENPVRHESSPLENFGRPFAFHPDDQRPIPSETTTLEASWIAIHPIAALSGTPSGRQSVASATRSADDDRSDLAPAGVSFAETLPAL